MGGAEVSQSVSPGLRSKGQRKELLIAMFKSGDVPIVSVIV